MGMEVFILAAMALMLSYLSVLIFVGGRPLRSAAAAAEVDRIRGPWPRLALLMPLTGAAAGLEGRLQALLRQDYPDYEVVFATRDAQDPATSVILSLMPHYPRARHVVAGPARSCGQKNHNLLAAVKLVGQTPDILVFCDSNQEAPPGWLRELTAPLTEGKAGVSSGFHHIIAANFGVAALGRAVTVLTMYLAKGFRCLNQPWGGSTAIRRSLFEELAVAPLWAENVVDDVSLAARLARAGIRVEPPPVARLYTPLKGETLRDWSRWLTRQWLYWKFCRPLTWLGHGLVVHLLWVLVVLAVMTLLLALLGLVSGTMQTAAAVLFLAGLVWLGLAMRALHPSPGPRRQWLAAFFAAMAMASWCHLKSLFIKEMLWRGISYQVGWRGRVIRVSSDREPAGAND
ncbi:MAG: glycosyltransferase [Desulfobaccales bacterium]|jgi:cellulose synthase/poly-beta-1,6-N-acetylglucosamine synthase-like glycosyltransferase